MGGWTPSPQLSPARATGVFLSLYSDRWLAPAFGDGSWTARAALLCARGDKSRPRRRAARAQAQAGGSKKSPAAKSLLARARALSLSLYFPTFPTLTDSVRKSKTSVQYRQALALPYLRWHSS